MFAELTKQCDYCSSHIYIEKKSDIEDKIVDGRRHLLCRCIVCGAQIPISVKMIPKEVSK